MAVAVPLNAPLITFLRNKQERADLFEQSISKGLNDPGNAKFRVWNSATNTFYPDPHGPGGLLRLNEGDPKPPGTWAKEHVFERQYLSATFVRRANLANGNEYRFPKRILFWLDEIANSDSNIVWVDKPLRDAKTNFFNIRSANFAMTAPVAALLNACAPAFNEAVKNAIQQVPMLGPNAPADYRDFIVAILNDFAGTFWGQDH